MDTEIRTILLELAKDGDTITYARLAEKLTQVLHWVVEHKGDTEMSRALTVIADEDLDNGQPLLSCLVVLDRPTPSYGDGFHKACKKIWGVEKFKEVANSKGWEKELIEECWAY